VGLGRVKTLAVIALFGAGPQADVFAQIILEPKRGSSKSIIHGVTRIKKQKQWCEQSSYGDANK
jgi:hypothetical protein